MENLKSTNEPEFVILSRKAITQYKREEITNGKELLTEIYRSVISNPAQLKHVNDYSTVGSSFLMMIILELSVDIDRLRAMASICYLCLGKAIMKDEDNLNLIKDRLCLLQVGHELLINTVISALKLKGSTESLAHLTFWTQQAPLKARDSLYKMEIADLHLHPPIHKQLPLIAFQTLKQFCLFFQHWSGNLTTEEVLPEHEEAARQFDSTASFFLR